MKNEKFLHALKKTLLISLFLLLGLLAFSFQSCSVLKLAQQKEPVYYDLAKALTETTIRDIFELENFSFEQSGSVDLEKLISKDKLQKILGEKILNKLTEDCWAQFENLKVKTSIYLTAKNGLYTIKYIRIKKPEPVGLEYLWHLLMG